MATLKDLAPEEKAKIGALIKKLSFVTSQKTAIESALLSQLHTLRHQVTSLERQNAKLTQSKRKLCAKLAVSEEKASLVSSKLAEKLSQAPVTSQAAVQTQGKDRELQNCGSQTEESPKEHGKQRYFQSIREEVARLSETLQTLADCTTSQAQSLPIARKSTRHSDVLGSSSDREVRLSTVLARSAANLQRSQILRDNVDEEKPLKEGKYRGKSVEFGDEIEPNELFTASYTLRTD